ncbi:AI-2E family transporter [Pannus brasiliensis CCIBt3594]|uniref:AI-2E family transporter n=1 Tax=Pannus brasiliensis CCIBt3594 TaxID=1427578 RepID=A0AAW9QRG1_9CHRO
MTLGNAIGLVILVIGLFVLWNIRQILLLAFMAIVLANVLNLLVTWLQHHRLKRSIALFATTAALLLGVIGIFGGIVPALAGQFRELMALLPRGIEKLWGQLQTLGDRLDPSILDTFPDLNTLLSQLQPLLNQIAGRGLSVFYGSLGVLLSLLLILALALMVLADPAPYLLAFIRLFPAFYRPRVRSILKQCDRDLKAWLKGIVFHMTIATVASWLGLSLIGIPLAFSQAVLAGFFTFIPNLGPLLSLIPPFTIALLEDPWKPWAVLFLYLWIYLLIQYFDRHPPLPILSVRELDLFPAFLLLAQLFFASLFGFLGLFLAVPLSLVGRVWLREAVIEDILDRWNWFDREE